MRHFPLILFTTMLLVLPAVNSVVGQEIINVAQVTSLSAEDAAENQRPVKLCGVVIEVGAQKKNFTLHDGARSTGVHLTPDLPCPALGDTVEVEGLTFKHSVSGHSHPRVEAAMVRVTGAGRLPAAEPKSIRELNGFQNFDQWVSVEGHVLRWKFRNTTSELVIVIVGPDGWTTASVHTAGRPELADQLMGARVRLTGVNAAENTHDAFGAMTVPSLQQLEILTPGNPDPFSPREVSMLTVAGSQIVAGARVKVRGTVLARFGERVLYVRGGDGAECNLLATPWPRTSNDEEYADAGAFPSLKSGDLVEMVGTKLGAASDVELQKFALSFCHVRVIGTQMEPEPFPAALPEVVAGQKTHDLVQVRGVLSMLQQLPMERGEWRTTMLLESDGAQISVNYQAPGRTAFDTLKVDDELLVNALVDSPTRNEPRQLRLASPGDVKSLGVSPGVRTKRRWLWGGGALAVLALLLGWIMVLRRNSLLQARNAAQLKTVSLAARESEQRWKLLFEQSPLSVQIFSPDGQTKRVNEAWRQLFRLTTEQGLAFNVLHDPDLTASGAVQFIRKAFEGEVVQVPPVPYPVSAEPAEIRWIGAILYPLRNEAGQIVEIVTIHNDITERKHAEDSMLALTQTLETRVKERTAELTEAQAELSRALDHERELGELKSRFVTMVSHEFRTPLGIIMSAIELIRNYDDRLLPEKRLELQQDIFGATRHMAGLMEQMLVLGRVEAGKLGCKTGPCDLEMLAGKLADECLSATNRKCPISWRTEGDLRNAQADESLLRHIFCNLIHNAVKYSPEGGTVEFLIRRQGDVAVFKITDKGIGIPEEDQKNLFEAFQRGSNVGEIPGTGLGLVIVKRCVDLHGGLLHLASAVGKGTTFTVNLPLFAG